MKSIQKTVLLILLWSAGITGTISAQKISDIDFDDIKLRTRDSLSEYYYPLLLHRFLQGDSTLTPQEYRYIYYGNVYYDKYNPYGTSENEKKFLELYTQKEYREALKPGLEELNENPVNMTLLYRVMVCYYRLGEKETMNQYVDMYFSLLNTIYYSGDGKSIQTAYVVIKVQDEYEILSDLELERTKQALVGKTDVFTISPKGQKPAKGEKKIRELYFNVSHPLGFLYRQFQKKD